ncbi:MAG TPA: lipoyl synthase [Candidatus Dormibacteraeota bacterium]|nr:lipoyl synthase [Candidatus Dormibacteraeota bacterium]
MAVARRHPEWIKVRAPGGEGYASTKQVVQSLDLHTVCEEAHCPNLAECWGHRTATFMLLGDVCTRNCGYCAVAHGRPVAVDPHEPERVAEGVARLGLRHVVVTSVDRDDLPDGGAGHFAATARAIKRRQPECTVEVLTPDFKGNLEALAEVVEAPIDVFNHNTETVPRLYKLARPGGRYDRCLAILDAAKRRRPSLLTKTGLMLGLGEEPQEVRAVLADLREVACDILTLGQYLQPTRQHLPIARYLTPAEFDELGAAARALGFRHVESGPLVRSSYHAWQHVG